MISVFTFLQILFENHQHQHILVMERIIPLLKENQVESEAIFDLRETVTIDKRPGSPQIIESRKFYVHGNFSHLIPEAKIQALNQKIEGLGLGGRFQQMMFQGSAFGDYGQIDNLFDEGKTHLRHEGNEVLVVQPWATCSYSCQFPLQTYQDLLENNEGWKGRVRMVAVNFDEKKDGAVEFVNNNGLDKIQHLALLNLEPEALLFRLYMLTGFTVIALVDKFGKIAFVGNPVEINMEDRINELLSQEIEIKLQAQKEFKPKSGLKDLTKDCIQTHFQGSQLLNIRANVTTSYQKGVLSDNSAVIEVYTYDNDHSTLQNLKTIKDVVGDVTELNVHWVKTVEAQSTNEPTCWKCHNQLAFPYYWLYWEEGTHFGCISCVERPANLEEHHYDYEKDSVLLTGKWSRIVSKGLGHNYQPLNAKFAKNPHAFSCFSCDNYEHKVGSSRYICLGCRDESSESQEYINLCQACKDQLASEQVKQKLGEVRHQDSHPILRVLYNTKGTGQF